jgi:hypothetical protein
MSETKVYREKAEMFQRRADEAMDPLSEQHYREMAAHYRSLLLEHLDLRAGLKKKLSDFSEL